MGLRVQCIIHPCISKYLGDSCWRARSSNWNGDEHFRPEEDHQDPGDGPAGPQEH